MSSLNRVILIGRLGKDPEVRTTPQGKTVANFSMATSERFKDKSGQQQENTEWHRIVVWGKLAEVVNQFVKKGSQVCIEGKLATRSWDDKDGQKKYTTEIIASGLTMLGGKADHQEPGGGYDDSF